MKTAAAIMYEQNQPVVVEEIDIDPPKTGEVLVKMGAAGVCHSDYSVVTGTLPYDGPTILGHEGAGTIAEVGAGVTNVKPGDRVMLTFITACGECFQCKRGRPNICDTHWRLTPRGMLFDGTSRFHKGSQRFMQLTRVGCMADYTVVSAKAVLPIPDEVSIDRAALVGCGVTTGVGAALNTAQIEPGRTAAIIGIGGVGINVVQGCRLARAGQIIAIDLSDERLNWSREFGATHTINPANTDPVEKVMEITDGIGVDYAFEVIGNPATILQAFQMVSNGGAAVVVGVPPRNRSVRIPAHLFPLGERRILGCMYGSSKMDRDMPHLLDLYLKGDLKLDELISQRYPLEQINEAFAEMNAGHGLRGVISFES